MGIEISSRERTLLAALDELSSSTHEVLVTRADGMSQNVLKVSAGLQWVSTQPKHDRIQWPSPLERRKRDIDTDRSSFSLYGCQHARASEFQW